MNPKQQFQQNKEDARRLADLTASDWFQRALNYAMMQYNHNLVSYDHHDGGFSRLVGAHQFMHELENLWKETEEPKQRPSANLNHNY